MTEKLPKDILGQGEKEVKPPLYSDNNGRRRLPPHGGSNSGHSPRRPPLPSSLTLLSFVRKLWQSPTRLNADGRQALFHSEKGRRIYKSQYAYLVFIADPQKKHILDARIVKTYPTLERIDQRVRSQGHAILLHPQPISIPKGFWQEWKTAREPHQRLELVKKHGLAKDEKIFTLTRIIVDVDQPYESAEPVVLKVFDKLGIDRGYALGRTKSGNLRGVLWLEPLEVEQREKTTRRGKTVQVIWHKEFYLRPNTKHANGHTHYQNFREFLAILYGLLEKEGLKVDWTFFDRVNHPVWYSKVDNRYFDPVRTQRGKLKFYDLYRRAKNLQAKEKLWELPKRGQPFNLTKYFWSNLWKEWKIELPAYVKNEFNAFTAWQKAVESLARRHTEGRFLKVIAPAVGWAKHLGLPEIEVESYLKRLLSDKRDIDRDLEKALKWARPLPFGKTEKKPRALKPSTYLDKALNYIQSKGGQVKRQELLKEIFAGQEWLLEKVMRYLEKKGLVQSSTEKERRRGRPSKVYTLGKGLPLEGLSDHSESVDSQRVERAQNRSPEEKDPLTKGIPLGTHFDPPQSIEEQSLCEAYSLSPEDVSSKEEEEFTLHNTRGAGLLAGLVGGGFKREYTDKEDLLEYRRIEYKPKEHNRKKTNTEQEQNITKRKEGDTLPEDLRPKTDLLKKLKERFLFLDEDFTRRSPDIKRDLQYIEDELKAIQQKYTRRRLPHRALDLQALDLLNAVYKDFFGSPYVGTQRREIGKLLCMIDHAAEKFRVRLEEVGKQEGWQDAFLYGMALAMVYGLHENMTPELILARFLFVYDNARTLVEMEGWLKSRIYRRPVSKQEFLQKVDQVLNALKKQKKKASGTQKPHPKVWNAPPRIQKYVADPKAKDVALLEKDLNRLLCRPYAVQCTFDARAKVLSVLILAEGRVQCRVDLSLKQGIEYSWVCAVIEKALLGRLKRKRENTPYPVYLAGPLSGPTNDHSKNGDPRNGHGGRRKAISETEYLTALEQEFRRLRREYCADHMTYYYNSYTKEWELIKGVQPILKLPLANGLSLEECVRLLRRAFENAVMPSDEEVDF